VSLGPWTSIGFDLPVYKALASAGAARVLGECRERCGLHGVLDTNRLITYQGLAQAFIPAGGDNQLILTDTGMALAESGTPVPDEIAAPEDIASLRWWSAVSLNHKNLLTSWLRQELKGRESQGLSRWNDLMGDAVMLGRAYADHLAATALADTVRSIEDRELRSLLMPLATLYGITQARRLAGPLVESGALSVPVVRSLGKTAGELCAQLIDRVPELCELAGYPESVTGSPLAADDYATTLTQSLTWNTGGPV
jgi:acyl-CoA oxidase